MSELTGQIFCGLLGVTGGRFLSTENPQYAEGLCSLSDAIFLNYQKF
jgi:hypothetical protein